MQKQGSNWCCEGDDRFDRNPPYHRNVSEEAKNPPGTFQGHKPANHQNQHRSRAASSKAKTTAANQASSAGDRDSQPLFLFFFLSTVHTALPSSLID